MKHSLFSLLKNHELVFHDTDNKIIYLWDRVFTLSRYQMINENEFMLLDSRKLGAKSAQHADFIGAKLTAVRWHMKKFPEQINPDRIIFID